MSQNKKSHSTVKFIDAYGKPIVNLDYLITDSDDYQVAKGKTNSKGMTYEIIRDNGTVLNIKVKSIKTNGFKKIKAYQCTSSHMVITVQSPKIMMDVATHKREGSSGNYQRKPYKVKSGDTLSEIAQKHGTTVRALAVLNHIKDEDEIKAGKVLRLPPKIAANGNNIANPKHNKTNHPSNTIPIHTQSHTKLSQPNNVTTTNKPPATPSTIKKSQEPSLGDRLEKGVNYVKEIGTQGLEKATVFKDTVVGKAEQLYKDVVDGKDDKEPVPSPQKIEVKEDRSKEGATPKATAQSVCKTNPACINSGKSELIREVNIRLAGFGGALPTDEFTDLTAKCIKQFQRDYMGVAETGKICGSLLVALDNFNKETDLSKFFDKSNEMLCPCGKCKGFGNNRHEKVTFNVFKKRPKPHYVLQTVYCDEHPGIHKSLLWGFKAMIFYFKHKSNPRGFYISKVNSGYRCIERNHQKHRGTTNHMGCALDLYITDKNGNLVTTLLEREVRPNWFHKYINATIGWSKNTFGLEREIDGADCWVHIDVREFEAKYKSNNMFVKSANELQGESLVDVAKKLGSSNLLGCSGVIPSFSTKVNTGNESLEDLITQLCSAISEGEGSYEAWNAGAKEGEKVKYGKMRDVPGTITGKTINELLRLSEVYTWQDKRRRFATGKYQTIPKTLRKAVEIMGLTGNELYDAQMQERVCREYLVRQKQPLLYNFVLHGQGSVDDAMQGAAQEWASVALPKGRRDKHGIMSNGGRSYHESDTNHANPQSSAKIRVALEKIYNYHHKK